MTRHRPHALPLLVAAALSSVASVAPAQSPSDEPSPRFSPDTVLVRFAPGTPAAERAAVHSAVGGRLERAVPGLDVAVVRIAPNTVSAARAAYERNPNVLYAEPNYIRRVYLPTTTEGAEPGLGIANNFDQQWGLHNTGQWFGVGPDPVTGVPVPLFRGVAGADIDAPEAWDISSGSAAVTIAVLDTGVACTHMDLVGKCVEQSSFGGPAGSSPDDVVGHGSHVAGIAAAVTDNGIGIAGVAPQASLAALKVCHENPLLVPFGIFESTCEDADLVAALAHAHAAAYPVVSMSLAGTDLSQAVGDAVDLVWQGGAVIVASAGNAYDDTPQFPAAYPNVIAVGSTDQIDNLSAFSSFGSWVSVLAPGTTILSLLPGPHCGQAASDASDCYGWQSGTSMSAPHVAGLAALLLAHAPDLDNAGIRAAIESSADRSGALGQNMRAWSAHGRIDLAAALTLAGSGGGGGGTDPTELIVDSVQAATQSAARGAKNAVALVDVRDERGSPIVGADVTGSFGGVIAEDVSAVTDALGVARLVSSGTFKKGTFTFCVSDVRSDPLLYTAPTPPDCVTR